MKDRFIPDPQDPSDNSFLDTAWSGAYANFWLPSINDGANHFTSVPLILPTPALTGETIKAQASQAGFTSTDVVTSGGIAFDLIFDAAATAAPAGFRADIEQAASILAATITNKITVNINIDYSGTGGGAAAGPDNGQYVNYSTARADLISNAASGDTTFTSLPAGSSIQGQSSVVVWNAQLKALGLLAPNSTTTDDGSATFATDINSNLLVGVALHELTHAMGRVPYGPQPDIFDLFRFTSAGTRLFQNSNTAPAAYFSVDGGNTKLADFGRTSDPSDFLNSGVQGPNDPFNEFYTSYTLQLLTAIDLKELDALGYHVSAPDAQPPTITNDSSLSIEALTAQTITSSLLNAGDNVSSAAQLDYTITTGPIDGTLLLNGSPTSSFTQADINNGLVSYHETASNARTDSFLFTIADAAGNVTGTNSFQIKINPFDALEYLASNTDLIQAFGLNTAAAETHYITMGFNEHRSTNSFDALEYVASYPDLIKAFGLNTTAAEIHYITMGFNEHRATSSFDAFEYLASNTDLIQAFGLNTTAAEVHYITMGFNEHRATSSFDALEYLASNTDLIQAFGLNTTTAEIHYVTMGFNEHRATNSFNAAQYLANYPDLIAAFGPNNFVAAETHYITMGFNEHRTDQAPVINGDSGNNTLVAKSGAIMTGGGGADTFVFNSALLIPATINDFVDGPDHLQISAAGFGNGLTSGGTAPLVTAATPASATHSGTAGYFIFDNAHTLWWDPTGGSGSDAIALAKLTGVATLHSSDFLLT